METFFLASKDESWKELREVVKEYPLVSEEGYLSARGFARYVVTLC